jgi:phosphonate transport system substrate-binding protein
MHRRIVTSVAGAALVAAALVGPAMAQSPSTPAGVIPETLILGLVPSQEADQLVLDAQPVADHLTQTLGIPTQAFVPTSYAGLVTALGTGQAHIGFLAPFTLVQAADQFGATIILQSVRFGATTYHTQWFTSAPDVFCTTEVVVKTISSGGDAPQDVQVGFCNGTDAATVGPVAEDALAKLAPDTTVAFVSPSSASGYIFPAVQMLNAGVGTPPEAGQFFDPATGVTPTFAGGHDKAVISVCQGDTQVGVSFNDARTTGAALEACGTDMSGVVVFALSPEIPNDGVAVAGDLDPALKQRIADALIAYGHTEEGSAVLFSIYEISEFGPADVAAFEIVRQAGVQVGVPE